jgi:signal peptidase I
MPLVRRTVRELVLTASAMVGAACIVIAIVCLTFDLRLLAFQSGSMSPTIRTGSLALARTVDAGDLARGDVVSVHTATGSRVTHRIVGIQRHGATATLELRGDANPVPDAATYEVSHADRVMLSVPYVGYLGFALTSPIGLVVLGGYLCYLLAVLLKRPRSPQHREALAASVASGLAFLSLVAAAAVGTSVLTSRSGSTFAFWTDSVTPVTTGALSTTTIPAPAAFTCSLNGLRTQAVFSWGAVTGATKYVFHYGTGGTTTFDAGTALGVTYGPSALTSGSGTAYVVAEHDYGSTVWTSAPSATRTYTFVLGVFANCS